MFICRISCSSCSAVRFCRCAELDWALNSYSPWNRLFNVWRFTGGNSQAIALNLGLSTARHASRANCICISAISVGLAIVLWSYTWAKWIGGSGTENDFKSNRTTGDFAPVAERTVARSLLASAVEPCKATGMRCSNTQAPLNCFCERKGHSKCATGYTK